jgi:hypothetical protein
MGDLFSKEIGFLFFAAASSERVLKKVFTPCSMPFALPVLRSPAGGTQEDALCWYVKGEGG